MEIRKILAEQHEGEALLNAGPFPCHTKTEPSPFDVVEQNAKLIVIQNDVGNFLVFPLYFLVCHG